MRTRKEYRNQALNVLRGNWSSAVICTLVFFALSVAVSGLLGTSAVALATCGSLILSIFLMPMQYSYYVCLLDFIRGEQMDVTDLFKGYKSGRVWSTSVLMYVYVLLWTLLLIVPGIIKAYSYALTPYILRDCPDLSGDAAIERSMQLMKGHKFQLFLLDLSFLGWILLSTLSLGIGLLWVTPYLYGARAAFYEDLVGESQTL